MRLAVLGSKGGVGKTTVAVSVAAALAKDGVALVDCDPNGGATHWLVPDPGGRTLDRDLSARRPMRLVDVPAIPGLKLSPAGLDLAELDDDFGATIAAFPISCAMPRGIKTMVFDCPPSWGALVAGALRVADAAIIVVDCHSLGLAGVGAQLDLLEQIRGRVNKRLQFVGIVPNRRDRTRDSRLAEDELRERFGRVLPTIRAASCMAEAVRRGCSIWQMPAHDVQDDVRAVVRAITKGAA